MKYKIVVFIFFFSSLSCIAQVEEENKKQFISGNLSTKSVSDKNAFLDSVSIKDYKIISYQKDTTYLDTSLTIQKEYKFNYLRKDDFELLPFSNVGQSYNKLGHVFSGATQFPQLGANAKHFNYMQAEDINYYHVPTPVTELFFKTVMEQGQLADGFFTANTSERFNFSIANKGLRSLGKYQNIRSSVGNFRFTVNFRSKNNRYFLRGHWVSQDIANQENGGITNRSQFESGEEEFTDRSRIDVAFQDAENFLVGKRYFIDHRYYLKQNKDSIKYAKISLGHQFNYETKLYRYLQTSADDFFGDSFQSANLVDRSQLRAMFNKVDVTYDNHITGEVSLKAISYNYDYFFKSILFTNSGVIQNQLKGNEFALEASWNKQIGDFAIDFDGVTNISGELGGTNITASAFYKLKNAGFAKIGVHSSSRMPDFNALLYQSNYIAYNWQNDQVFQKQDQKGAELTLNLNKWFNISVNYDILDNYTYFTTSSEAEGAQVIPVQNNGSINYLKVKFSNEFKLGKFALANTVMYQNVDQDNLVLNVPELVTRNTLYFSDHLFKKAMYLQTGITFKYFSSHYTDAYNPLLAEFYTQNTEKFGGFPLIDFFINAKVKQTRIYLKAEHFNSPFSEAKFYSAPDYPYRDFIVRFGLVWNFFI
ncbi:putative porin [Ascidiimonas sp. W6]|uniref:putative porin n=1 Tax=Ascidiimonas meishanensis TaxID=3128903 RepID=UPI0030EC7741